MMEVKEDILKNYFYCLDFSKCVNIFIYFFKENVVFFYDLENIRGLRK